MKKRNLISKVLVVVMLITMVCGTSFREVKAEDNVIIRTAQPKAEMVGNDLIISKGTTDGILTIRNQDDVITKELFEDVKGSIEITNHVDSMSFTTSFGTYIKKDGSAGYRLSINWVLDSDKTGSLGTFTVKFDGFEETYNVIVQDFENTVGTIELFGDEENLDEDGCVVYKVDLASNGSSPELVFKNLNGVTLGSHGTVFDGSMVKISNFINAQEGISWTSDKTGLKVDTVVGLTLQNSEQREGYKEVIIYPAREGDAYFTVSYGGYSQKVHVVVTNTKNLTGNIELSDYELTVNTGETFELYAYSTPSNAYYDGGEWHISKADGSYSTDNTCNMERNSNVARITFYEPGVYYIQNSKTYDSEEYMWGSKKFNSTVCTVTVVGDVKKAPEGSGMYAVRLDESILPPVTNAPIETPVPTETPTPTPIPTAVPTPTPLPEGQYYVGDVDLNGNVNAKDALLVLKHSAKIADLKGISLELSEVNGDDSVNAEDALGILKVSAKLEEVRIVEL